MEGLCFGGSKLTIRCYVDSDFEGDHDWKKYILLVFTFVRGAVIWLSKLPIVEALSTREIEYMEVY